MHYQRVLVVSYFFPPAGTTGVIRIAKFVHYFPQFGWLPVVVASSDPGVWHEPSLFNEVPPNVSVTRLRGLGGQKPRSAQSNDSSTPASSPLNWLKDKIKHWLREYVFIPDSMILWVPGAVWAGLRLCRQMGIDAIWASGGPWSNHLAAVLIGRLARRPVVLDFRDLWALGPPFDPRSRWRRWWDHRLERFVVEHAAVVTAVTDNKVEDLRIRHPGFPVHRIIYLSHGFDSNRNSVAARVRNESQLFTFLYTGQMGGFRSARYFLQALQLGLRSRQLTPDQIRLTFVGAESPDPWGKCLNHYIREFGLGAVVETSPPVSYGEVLQLQAQADALLVFKGLGEALPGGALPHKIVDYLGASKPILALAPRDSNIYDFITATGAGVCADPENVDDIVSKIEMLVRTRGSVLTRNEAEIRQYSLVEQTRRLAELLSEVVSESKRKK